MTWLWIGKADALHQRDDARPATKRLADNYKAAQREAADKALAPSSPPSATTRTSPMPPRRNTPPIWRTLALPLIATSLLTACASPAAQGAAGRAAATADDHGAGVPARLPADAVLVAAADVQASAAAAVYAVKAQYSAAVLA